MVLFLLSPVIIDLEAVLSCVRDTDMYFAENNYCLGSKARAKTLSPDCCSSPLDTNLRKFFFLHISNHHYNIIHLQLAPPLGEGSATEHTNPDIASSSDLLWSHFYCDW